MFTGKPLPPLPQPTADAQWAAGWLYACDQQALLFGSNRRTPVDHRPVVEMGQDGVRVVVLPCTTKVPQNAADFFELPSEGVMWKRAQPADQRNFAHVRYEVVDGSALHGKIGVMEHALRLDLMRWLKSRY